MHILALRRLYAHNLIDNLKQECRQLAQQYARAPEVEKWLLSIFRNWLNNEGPVTLVTELPADAPEWMVQGHAEGTLTQIDWDAVHRMLRGGLSDWLNYAAQQQLNLNAVSVPQAQVASEEYHRGLAKNPQSQELLNEEGIDLFLSCANGYNWVQVFSASALDREGEEMGHCVGSYAKEVENDHVRVFSLRDAKNFPHITVEYDPSTHNVTQIKGKANDVVVKKYREYICPFLLHLEPDRIFVDKSGLSVEEVKDAFKKAGKFTINRKTVPVETVELSNGVVLRYYRSGLPDDSSLASEHPRIYDFLSASSMFASPKLMVNDQQITLEHYFYRESFAAGHMVLSAAGAKPDTDLAEEIGMFLINKASLYLTPILLLLFFGKKVSTYKEFSLYQTSENVPPRYASPEYFVMYDPSNSHRAVSLHPKNLVATAGDDKWITFNTNLVKKMSADVQATVLSITKKFSVAKLSKSTQMLLLSLHTKFTGEQPTTKGTIRSRKNLNYATVGSNKKLVDALVFFAARRAGSLDLACDLAKRCDGGDVRAILKAKGLSMSGHLYSFCRTFIVLCLMKDKAKAADVIISSVGLTRQFTAFASSKSSFLANSFLSRMDEETGEVSASWAVINKHLPDLVHLTSEQLSTLLAIRGTPAFKKFLTTNYVQE